jgi:hypothetical protein
MAVPDDARLVRLLRLGIRAVSLLGRAVPVVVAASGVGALVALVVFAFNPPELSSVPVNRVLGRYLAEMGRCLANGVAIGAVAGAAGRFTRALLWRSERVRIQVRRLRLAARVAVSQEKA